MNLVWTAAFGAIALLVVKISQWCYRWSNPKCNGKLPPGSMGFPIIGETFDFFKPHDMYEISPFVMKRMLRYGPIFRTNVLGLKTVVSTDTDVNHEILKQENTSFVFRMPGSFEKMLGKDSLAVNHGKIHKHIKQITLNFLGSDSLKRNMIKEMDRLTRELLESKGAEGIFDVKDEVSRLVVRHLTPKMLSNLPQKTQEKLMDDVKSFNYDWFRPHFTLATLKKLFRSLRGRRGVMKVIVDAFKKRRETKEKYGDFLDTMLDNLDKDDSLLTEDSAQSLVFFLYFASHESTSTTTSLTVKLLSKHPRVLQELKKEHMAILESRENKESGITYEEYRHKMIFTNMVINEVLRLINLAPLMFRMAVEDVEIKGYTIPAGWNVLVTPPMVHYDPKVYENPMEFNPWRWEGKDVRSVSKTFMAFGGGIRQCAGADFARLQISLFLHYLVTNYNFSLAKDNDVMRVLGLYSPKEMPINVSPFPK
nr:cytochrome P450 70815v2 [Iberis amara]